MPPTAAAGFLFVASYLLGSIPFGYLVARLKGVDLFRAGSGNIGATNVARVLGRPVGALVFVLDFAKGAVPVAAAEPLAAALTHEPELRVGLPGLLQTGAALFAFVGHLFPLYLGFRGGKGVATGAGAVSLLVPGPAAEAVGTWIVVALASRYVSLASIAAVAVLALSRVAGTPDAFGEPNRVVTLFCLVGAGLVVVKHHGNIRRLLAGNESRIGDCPMRHTILKMLHVLALGFWFGGAAFFSFVVAPTQNATFKEVVHTAPNDRTANLPLVPEGRSEEQTKATKNDLASALFGAGVGPVFPKFFLMQAVCGGVALITALSWWKVGRTRVVVIALAVCLVFVCWWVSDVVSELRVERLRSESARTAFAEWHFVSLGLSAVTTLLAGVGLAMAARLPADRSAGGGQ
jgi:acyl-phosphate glycerol 3-phosphate acyltransferase